MTTLGSLVKVGQIDVSAPRQALDLSAVIADVALLASASPALGPQLGDLATIVASLTAWTNQDDDAHEPCSLTACRAPLHPGPCKGWKGTLHSVSPHIWRQVEEERVGKANARRLKRIADLRAQGKPIPRRLLAEIKAKPAPGTSGHNATHAMPTPHGQVNQKADLLGGQSAANSAAINKAAGVVTNTAPLPTGPKGKKPTVAGRGPAFVITQPKVTDQYKLDKAAKLTPADWNALSPADRTAIRDELEAIKVRGFGPQQTKADALLAKLPAGNTLGGTTPASTPTPNAPHAPSAAPGRVTLGQATKAVHAPSSAPKAPSPTPALPAPAPSSGRNGRDQNGILGQTKPGGAVTSTSVGLPNGYRVTRDGMGYSLKHNGKLIRTSATQDALVKYAHDHHAANTKGVSGTPSPSSPAAPASPSAVTPQAPGPPNNTPGAFPPHVQHARAVAGRALGGRPTAKVHLDTYDKLSKADFDLLDAATQRTIRDDLANAKAKFLDPKKQQAAKDLLDRFGSRHPAPAVAPSAPTSTATHVDDVKVGDTFTSPTWGKVTVTETPAQGKIKGFRMTSSAHGGREVVASRRQMAVANGLDMAPKATGGPAPASGVSHVTPTNLVAQIRKHGSADVDLGGKTHTVGFESSSHPAKLVMISPGGTGRAHYMIRTADGTDHTIGKGQLIAVHPPKAATPTPAVNAKGYSDPQNELVKAVTSGMISTDDVLKATARLSPESVGKLDDADKKVVLQRLAFIATHPKATAAQKAQAAAYGRIINSGSPTQTSRTWDHTPSLGELHREEEKTGALNVPAALAAARMSPGLSPGTTDDDRVKAIGKLTKAQFDALPPDEQREITDALQVMHYTVRGGQLNPDVEKVMIALTGVHPGLHRLRTAEADFRAGKITGDGLHSEFLHARVQTPALTSRAHIGALEDEAARVARDNPTLPTYARVRLAGDPKYGTAAYDALSIAGMKHMWEDAPRLSTRDLDSIFRPSEADLSGINPIHAQAVRDLREHVLKTGLRGQPGVPTGSPWSLSTRQHAASALLGVTSGGEITPDRMENYRNLSDVTQALVKHAMRDKLLAASNDHAKTDAWLAVRELEGKPPLTGDLRDAVLAATERFTTVGKHDTYRKLTQSEFDDLPFFAKSAIQQDLNGLQAIAEQSPVKLDWSPQDNAMKVFPAALAAHLADTRPVFADRDTRNASDISNYGTRIIDPASRVSAYNRMTPKKMDLLSPRGRQAIFDDLGKIENDSSLPLQTRYDAAFNKDVLLKPNSAITLTPSQLGAVQGAEMHPNARYSDAAAAASFNYLPKNEYDSLSPVYREAIDERIKGLPGTDQQALNAKFHPAAAVNTPAGTVPTQTNPNVPPHVQDALDTIYGVHPKSHTMAHQLSTYGGLRGSDFNALNVQEQQHMLSDLSFIHTTAKGPSAAKAGKLLDRFTPPGTPAGQTPANPAIIPPANSVPGQVRYATPLVGTLVQATNKGQGGDGWLSTPGGKQVWGKYGAAGLLLMHQDPSTGEKRYLMVQRGPGISDPGKWQFPGGAIDSKETFHQGGTREVIEELGFKADALKNAKVHGEHTNQIPGSTWKYVSVAAQVDTMLKPDLSSHHARLETADAKWMTETEIKALDTSGSLLAPLAGGKLEQNVLSLFPQGTPSTKLGQVARPGPVSKRQGRLAAPAGGRQAPANFNAWTSPHKKSTGKNLVGSKAEIDAMRQKIKNDRTLYDGKTADGRLAAIGAMQGFDDTPTVESKSEIDRLLATGDYIEAFRGVSGAGGGWSARGRGRHGGKTAADINEEMRTGPAYYGTGIFGNGYYLATDKQVARQYSDGSKGSVVRMLIPKSALTEKYDKVEKEAQSNSSRTSKAKGSSSYELSTFWDPGRWGAAKGLDGIEINPHHRAHAGGGAGHVASHGKPAFNWLNRSVLIIQKEPG